MIEVLIKFRTILTNYTHRNNNNCNPILNPTILITATKTDLLNAIKICQTDNLDPSNVQFHIITKNNATNKIIRRVKERHI